MADHKSPLRAGKSAPRLIQDLLDYDPRYRRQKDGRNLLFDDAPQYSESENPPVQPRKGEFDCRHQLMLKQDQSTAPTSDLEQPDSTTKYEVSTFCSECRYYFDITVDYTETKEGAAACQITNENYYFHHFQPTDLSYPDPSLSNKYKPVTEIHKFVCSGPFCHCRVEIRIFPPRLNPDQLGRILTASKVFNRGKNEIEADPVRYEGNKPLVPFQALGYLRQYISDARNGTAKRIAKRNKKYMLAFGEECEPLFEYLDFESFQAESSQPEEGLNHFWRPPVVGDHNREFLHDVEVELNMKMSSRPASEYQSANAQRPKFMPIPARRHIDRSLRCVDYPTTTRSRTVDLSVPSHPHYASLGAVDDFEDHLLIWAYKRQCVCDPDNKPYYLDCLQAIAQGRSSADLHTEVAITATRGEYGRKAIEEAYKYFDLDPKTKERDEYIMGVYKSRIESAPRQKEEYRNRLTIIGKARNSDKIIALANDRAMTYEEALEVLGVSAETAPDMIGSVAVAAANDGDRAKVARALRIIANHTGNHYLQQAATDVEAGIKPKIDMDEAYRRLQIQDRTVPNETVFAYYQHLTKDAQNEHFDDALRAIAHDRNSNYLFARLQDPNAILAPARSTSDQPIGLDNIGNTCYLNSLLQYLYTVKDIRDVVMNFEDHRMSLNEADVKRKKIGGRSVTKAEIMKSQNFVEELRSLFQNLKTASTTSIKPSRDLAELTLFSSEMAASFRRNSVSSPRPAQNAVTSFGEATFGPEPRPQTAPSRPPPTPVGEDIEMIDRPGDKNLENGSESSETTLVDIDALPAYHDAVAKSVESSPTTEKGDDDQQVTSDAKSFETDAVMTNGENVLSTPEKPPPIPPRNKSGLVIQTNEIKNEISDDELWRFGSQQDVVEVIDNVNFRLQCALRPTNIDESGEQIDVVIDTFYGSTANYIQKTKIVDRKVSSFASINVYPAAEGTRDIYGALDVYFDEQDVPMGEISNPQHFSIINLPPILQIVIQRTQYDKAKNLASKNQNPVTFPETIYLDRYMDSDSDSSLMRRRREAWKWKKELRKLEARQQVLNGQFSEIPVAEALNAVKNIVADLGNEKTEGIPIESDFAESLQERTVEIIDELDAIGDKITNLKQKVNEQFMDMNKYEYKLRTVFIHRGEAGGGHYWIYIYDSKTDTWRKYNDNYVTTVKDQKEIFNAQGVVDGTPYYLAYVQSERQDLVEAVYRDVPELVEDTNMQAGEIEAGEMATEMEVDDVGGVAMERSVRHVEHIKPRPLRPKPTSSWESGPRPALDANGEPW